MKIVNSKFKIIPGFTPTPKFLVRGFTIIELLITIFIFSSVMIMASSSFATSYISGRTHSSSSMEANRSLSLVLDVIGQKMANASGKNGTIYGFKESGGRLSIVLKDDLTCVYFDQDSNAVKMLQQACSTAIPVLSSTIWEKISSPNINITKFLLSPVPKNEWSTTGANAKTAPYITIKIVGEDTKTKGKATLQSTYSIPAYTYNKW